MANPLFPNVPNVPGVPPVRRSGISIANDVALLVADAELLFSMFGPPKWGIFSNTTRRQVLFPDSIFAFSYRNDWQSSGFPVEGGGFESYNKVASPFQIKVTAVKYGSDGERQEFLNDVRAIAASLSLFDIVTPDGVYLSCNIEHWDLERRGSRGPHGGSEGISLIMADLWFTEIRVTGGTVFQNTAQPSGADPQNGGTFLARDPIQPVTVTPL